MTLQHADSSAAKFTCWHVQLTESKIFHRCSDRSDIIPLTPNHFQHWINTITFVESSDYSNCNRSKATSIELVRFNDDAWRSHAQ